MKGEGSWGGGEGGWMMAGGSSCCATTTAFLAFSTSCSGGCNPLNPSCGCSLVVVVGVWIQAEG